MARVPTTPIGAVQQRATPTVYQDASGATPDAFGMANARALQSLAGSLARSGKVVENIAEHHRQQEVERVAKEADAAWSSRLREFEYGDGDKEPGYYGRQGADAVSGYAEYAKQIQAERLRFASEIKDPQARAAFDDLSNRRIQRAADGMARHRFSQARVAQNTASEAVIGEAIDDAVARFNDPQIVSQSLSTVRSEARDLAQREGLSPEAAASKVQESESAFHRRLFDRHLAEDPSGKAAKSYFETHKDSIDGRAHTAFVADLQRVQRLNDAEIRADVSDAAYVLGNGFTPPNLQELHARVKGTKYAAPLQEAVQDHATMAKFIRMSPAEQAATLRETGGQVGTTPEGRPIVRNADGSVSTERTITVTDERINDGKPTNIPSMFGGVQVSEGEAIERIAEAGGKDPETGRVLPGFSTIDDAERAAQQRSKSLGKVVEQHTMTARQVRLLDKQQRYVAAQKTALDKGEGLALASRIGVIDEPAEIKFNDPSTLRRRATQARVASDHFGRDVLPMSPTEIDQFGETLEKDSADAATGTLNSVVTGLGRDGAMRVAGETVEKRPALAMAIVAVADRPLVAREIIQGERLRKENPDFMPSKSDRQTEISNVLGNVFEGMSADLLSPIVSAANALYAARVVPTGKADFDPEQYSQALRDAVGTVHELNGRNIFAPVPGMTESDFSNLMDNVEKLDATGLARFGNGAPVHRNGAPFSASMFDSRMFGVEAQLISAGFDGRYRVLVPGDGFIMTEDGQPYVLNLRSYHDAGKPTGSGGGGGR